jgi:type IV pilus assembly protein PilY1
MKKRILIFLFSFSLIFKNFAYAEDIDLFLGTPPGTTEVPNVLIIMDNTANWTTPFANEKAALISVFNSLPVDKFRVGLMFFTETGNPNNNVDGGYVRAAIRLMNSTNKSLYGSLINGLDVGDDKSNGGKAGLTMAEAYYYFSGSAPRSGNNKVKTDYAGNVAAGAYLTNSRAVWALSGNALPSFTGTPYTSPVVTGCAKNFIIYISNGAVQDNNSDTTTATNLLSAAGGTTTAIPISPSGSQNNVADEWARFMKTSSQNITTYTVDVNKVTNGQGPGWTALLKSMANVSGGKYFDVSSANNAGAEISDALNKIFTEILAVNSVFASASLPTTANTQNTYLNQVFIGVFRPDSDAFPRWPGNLKQYKMGKVNGQLQLLDANDQIATNSNTNFITECARSFWTPSTTDTYWSFKPQGSCLAVTNSTLSNYPDGNIVEKGAQAYTLRSTTTRTVKTCSPTSCTTLTDFNTGNSAITQALLNNGGSDRTTLINWMRGQDLADEDLDGVTSAEMRPSVHGDVIHGRPVAINYGTEASPQVVVFYGGNDGVLRAINGNRTSSIGSVTAGSELWSFVPPEFYGKIKRLYDNTLQVQFPGSSGTTAPKGYGFDAPIAAFDGTISATPKKFVYAPMRRGGRALYAFDVTDPASPTLKWKLGCPNSADDTNCTTGFTGIGQTWSRPSIITASGYGSGSSPILVMGGGYDTCEDTDNGTVNNNCTASSKGKQIYVVDADTGALLNTLSTDRGVIADMTIVVDSNGKAQYGYTTDLGGNIYRINMLNAAPAAWTITKVASLGCSTTATCNSNRKFMFPPDVVIEDGVYYILAGSGDREKPLTYYSSTTAVTNYFFMVKDEPTNATYLSSESSNCGGNSVICLSSLLPITSGDPNESDLQSKKGWYLALASSEQVVNAPLTISNVVNFSTHTPAVAAAGTCGSNLGNAKAYNIFFKNAGGAIKNLDGSTSRYENIIGGGLAPSPVAGKVKLDDGTEEDFCIGCGGEILKPKKPPVFSEWTQPKSRVYWYIEQ